MENNNSNKIMNFIKTKWYFFVIGILLLTTIGYSSSAGKLEEATNQIAKLEENVSELEKANKSIEDENEKLISKIKKADTEKQKLETKLSESEKQLEESQKEVETLTAQVEKPTEAPQEVAASGNTANESSAVTTGNYIANASTGKFHYATCGSVKQMNESNKVSFSNREAAVNAGYDACKRCHP